MFSGTHITYYHLCHRKLWLMGNGIRMENATDNVYVEEGKQIGEHSYRQRAKRWQELAVGSIKVDHFDFRERLVREVKKSPTLEHAHIAQVKYYLYVLEEHGIACAGGVIEYPKQRKTRHVSLTEEDRLQIAQWLREITKIVEQPSCPELKHKSYCSSCAFHDFCFI